MKNCQYYYYKRREFLPKMHQNTFGGRAPSGPDGGAKVFPRFLAAKGALRANGGRGGKEEGKGDGKGRYEIEREGEWEGMGWGKE